MHICWQLYVRNEICLDGLAVEVSAPEHASLLDSVSTFITSMENSKRLEKIFNIVPSAMVTQMVL